MTIDDKINYRRILRRHAWPFTPALSAKELCMAAAYCAGPCRRYWLYP
jgi:hypothetical protein